MSSSVVMASCVAAVLAIATVDLHHARELAAIHEHTEEHWKSIEASLREQIAAQASTIDSQRGTIAILKERPELCQR